MRIAFVSSLKGHTWGGSEELWYHSALALRSRGVEVAACIIPRTAPQLERLMEANCRLYAYQPFDRRFVGQVRRGLRKAGLLKDWLDEFRPTLVINSLPQHTQGRDLSDLCRKRRIPYVIIIHQATEQCWPDDDEIDLLRNDYTSAVACCFVSESNRRLVEAQFAVRFTNAQVIRNPFNVRYDAAPPWPDGDELKLACVGRLDGWFKGQDLLFEVMAMPKWRGRPVSLTLFGTGPNAKGFTRLAEMHKLNRIIFAGHVSNIEAIWATHHALALPSRAEGLPLAIVEAMLCGRPCLVTNVAGNAELLTDGESGFVAPAPTLEFVDAALERMWTCREKLKSMGQKAAEQVRRFVPANPVAQFIELIIEWAKKQTQPT